MDTIELTLISASTILFIGFVFFVVFAIKESRQLDKIVRKHMEKA